MNTGFIFAALACATSIAFAGEPLKANPKFLWDSSTDTDARVVTGSPEKTSGYWYDFNDENDEGSSQIVFPASVEHGYINYYEPLIEYYGGITGTIKLDEGYEHPYVGFAFNIWDEEGHGANISEWGGFCLEYSSELDFYVEIGVEDEANITGLNNYKVPIKSSLDTVLVEVPWAKFAQESGWGKQADMDSVLAHAAIVRLKFEGEAGTKGHFLLKKMGSLGQCKSNSVTSPNDEPRKVDPAFLWDGSTDTEGRVITGSPEETSGWWYDFNDHNDGGESQLVFPSELEEGYTNFYGTMIEAFGGIMGTVKLNEGFEHPYAGFAFNIWNFEDNGDGYGVDISEWGGFCLEYSSEVDFYVEIGVEDERTITGLNNYKALIKSSSDTILVEVPWAKFAQESGWGKQADMDSVLAHAAIVRLNFWGEAGSKGEFFMSKLGSLGTCDGSFATIRPAVNSQVNVSVSGRTVNFEGVVPSAKVSVMDLQGHIVKSATAASAMDLSSLPVGIYMLRVQGSNVHYSKRIILK